jgi:predicted nucleic acid-binding protein
MRFWDASAITPLLVQEPSSSLADDLLRDEAMVVWWGTRIECASAIRRRERDGGFEPAAAREAIGLLDLLSQAWSEVAPSEVVRASAERALAVHPLRAADALQLAAALTWRREPTRRADFVCLDDRLREAASREGLLVMP